MQSELTSTSRAARQTQLDHRLHDIGWGLLFVLTGTMWLVPETAVPPGTWLFGVAGILLGVNVVRYAQHVAVSGFSVVIGLAALIAALSQLWRTDLPLLAICLIIIGVGLVAKPLIARAA